MWIPLPGPCHVYALCFNVKNLNNKVILLGQVDDMMSFYKGLDIFILPSIQPEPFGLVVIEAMNNKLPVVATNHGGPVEIIENKVNETK